MMKQKIEMKPGVRYRGYAFINEYGEINFSPEQKGSREGERMLVVDNDDYTIYGTKRNMIFHFKLKNGMTVVERTRKLLSIMNNFITFCREYDF